MHAPPPPENGLLRWRWELGTAYLDDPRRNTAHYREIGDIPHHHGICPNDDVIADPDAAQDLGACTELHTITDHGRAEGIVGSAVADGDAVTDQTIIPDHSLAMDDDTAV